MLLTRLEPHEAIDAWPYLYRLLLPALKRDTERTPGQLFDDLANGVYAAWVAHDFPGHGVAITAVNDESGEKTLQLHYGAGSGGPAALREAVGYLENAARGIGCITARITGRPGLKRALQGYEMTGQHGSLIELRKVL